MESSLYRENPLRAVHILSAINPELLAKLTPQITAFRADGGSPITVYIDSYGGNTYVTDSLIKMLRAPDQRGRRCPLTTVVTNTAASAAADLLISGDYAIAFPTALIHYHGTRRSAEGVTLEDAHLMAGALQSANEQFALRLAERIISRLLFLLTIHRQEIDSNPHDTDISSPVSVFVSLLEIKLSAIDENHAQLVREAREMQQQTSKLVQILIEKVSAEKGNSPPETSAEAQIRFLKALLDYELSRADRPENWTLLQGGFDEIRQHFLQFADFLAGEHTDHRERLVRDYGTFMLSKAELTHFQTLASDSKESAEWLNEKASPRMAEFWYFVLCLCRQLQRGENPFEAQAAYWLGLVDEVLGTDLPCMRLIFESQTAPVDTSPSAS